MGLPMLGMNFGLGSFFDPTGPKKVIFRVLLWGIIENVAQIAIWLISLLRQVYDLDFGVSNERTRTITTNFEKWAYIFGANQVIKVEGRVTAIFDFLYNQSEAEKNSKHFL